MDQTDKKHTILVVEDEGLLRELLVEKMTLEGFETFSASDGQTGLDIALQKQPDMVLLDLLMPNMGGMEVLQHLREDERGRGIPVIILSNLSNKESVVEGAERGAVEYLVKSNFSLDDIAAKVKEIGRLRMQW
jgi:DNA-binding response OmpR family regulator